MVALVDARVAECARVDERLPAQKRPDRGEDHQPVEVAVADGVVLDVTSDHSRFQRVLAGNQGEIVGVRVVVEAGLGQRNERAQAGQAGHQDDSRLSVDRRIAQGGSAGADMRVIGRVRPAELVERPSGQGRLQAYDGGAGEVVGARVAGGEARPRRADRVDPVAPGAESVPVAGLPIEPKQSCLASLRTRHCRAVKVRSRDVRLRVVLQQGADARGSPRALFGSQRLDRRRGAVLVAHAKLVSAVEEQRVAANRPAQRDAGHVEPPLRALGEQRPSCVQFLVLKEVIGGSVPLVPATLGDEVDDRPGSPSELSLEVRRLDLERFDSLHRDRLLGQSSSEQVAGDRIVVLGRIDHRVHGTERAVAVDGERRVARPREADAGSLERDGPIVPAHVVGHHRDAGNLRWRIAGAAHPAGGDPLDFGEGADHRDFLGDGAEFEADVVHDLLTGDQLNALGLVGPETFLLRYQPVGARVEAGQPIESGARAERLGNRSRPQGFERDRRVADRRS